MANFELENLIVANPTELMRVNPAALIVNRESYELINSKFDPRRFDFPQVARVRTFSSTREEAIQLYLIDGNTRTKYVNDHQTEIATDYPEFEFRVRDVTQSLLDNGKVVPPSRLVNGGGRRDYLELDEWLTAVIPPTVEHSQIAPDRIAAYLINGWDNMVGAKLAERFSAIAALSLLQNPRVPIATDHLLIQYLTSQAEIMAGENPAERRVLQDSLLKMTSVIRQTRLLREHITESAFILVASGSPVIGGEREAFKQVYGLLYLPTVEAKLAEEAGVREQMRQELGKMVMEAFQKAAGTPNMEQVINSLGQALRDPALDYQRVKNVLSSTHPIEEYNSTRQELNVDKLQKAYLQSQKRTAATDVETTIIGNIGKKTYLEDRDLPSLIRAVDVAAGMLDQVKTSKAGFAQRRSQLQSSGVSIQTIADALIVFDKAEEQILAASTSQTIALRTTEVKASLVGVESKINREVATFRAGQLIDEIYGDRLQNGSGAIVKTRIAAFLSTEFGKIDAINEVVVRQRVRQLSTLEEDLHTQVITGVMRLQTALRTQEENTRRAAAERQQAPTPIFTVGSTAARSVEGVNQIPPIVEPRALTTNEEPAQTKQEAQERRIRINNERLQQIVRSFRANLEGIDLDNAELTPQSKNEVRDLIETLGTRIDHPGIIQIIEEKYPRLLSEKTQALQQRVQKEADDNFKSTRTNI